jgi:hypothetical protein
MRLLQILLINFRCFHWNVPTAGVSLQFEATSWAEINKGKKKNNGPQRLKINNVLEQRYIDREKSWLVCQSATRSRRYIGSITRSIAILGIFSNNLDEFLEFVLQQLGG